MHINSSTTTLMGMTTSFPVGTVHHSEGLARAGWTDREVHAWVRSGKLVRIARGTFVSGGSASDRIIAVAQRSPDFIVSHQSAATLHGFPTGQASGPVHLTRPGRGAGRNQPHRIVHAGQLSESDVTEIDGVRATTVARTLLDLCRTVPFLRAVVAADHVLHHALCLPEEILSMLHEQRRYSGMPAARRALAFADGRAESPGESWTRVMFHVCGLPSPELQVTVRNRAGDFLGRVDGACLGDNCLYEYDGRGKYGSTGSADPAEAVLSEKRREDRIREAGHALVRFTSADSDRSTFVGKVERGRRLGRMTAAGVTGTLTPAEPIRLPIKFGRHSR